MKGFTLLEIIIALGMLALVVLGVIFFPVGFKKNVDLDGQSGQIINVLNTAQSNAKSRRDNAAWGVHLENNRYVLFRGSSYNPTGSANQIFHLPKGLEIALINLNGGGSDIIFSQLSGETLNFGAFQVRFVSDSSKYREIKIDFSGRAAVSGMALPPQNTRFVDSRHTHFQLGWTIKNSTKLFFFFPRVSRAEEILMEEYFNVDKTDFDWSGSFTIDGKLQEFRIHTHYLGNFDTLLSITRDRSAEKNNEEVRIYINFEGYNREIAHYLANGSVEIGDYGGIMTIQ